MFNFWPSKSHCTSLKNLFHGPETNPASWKCIKSCHKYTAVNMDMVPFKKNYAIKLTLFEEQGFSRTKRAKQSQRESVSVLRTASQSNITVLYYKKRHTHKYTHSLTNNTNAHHSTNSHSISHRWKLSFPSAEASGNVFTPANRAWSPFLFLSLSLAMCEYVCVCVRAHLCRCANKALGNISAGRGSTRLLARVKQHCININITSYIFK